MLKRKSYRCPVCKKPLTEREYKHALKIHAAQQEHLRSWENRLKAEERSLKKKVADARADGRNSEKSRTARLVKGYKERLRRMHDKMKHLESGTTPQGEGLADEKRLTKRLAEEFRGDAVQRKGHAGDVLHIVKESGHVAGVIIYECKRTPKINSSHVRQALRAKQSRHADFAVLVTTGTKRGFAGLAEMSGVLVVSPLGVLSLADLLRGHLIEILRAGIERKKRARIATQLLRFIKSTEFKNPIEEVVGIAADLEDGVKKEFEWHMKDWEHRVIAYRRIKWDGTAVQENVRRVLQGGKPKRLDQPKTPLQLPAATTQLIS
jgi:Uncharacterized protein conserved in bacteria (DUF2130)